MLYFGNMITALDHLVLLCPSIEEGTRTYQTLLGRAPDWQSIDSSGIASVYFQLDGIALELIAPHGDTPTASKLKERLQQKGSSLQSIVFSSDDLDTDRRIFERRALKPEAIQFGQSSNTLNNKERRWSRFRISDEQACGVRMFFLQRSNDDPLLVMPAPSHSLSSLDHVVINTSNSDRATALYGARLGLRLALDISIVERDIRLVSFKAGNNRIELSHRISKANETDPDILWGITWRTHDIDGAQARMVSAGLNVSEIRKGLSKGTRVFTVRDGTLNVPTLILAEDVSA
jgi:catechol 2,3-dioxygenase-like lactoylglutathione lyase family enzyme